jgi:prepilin signal peptidase PulO-like enzyme (type II secretory pathway)
MEHALFIVFCGVVSFADLKTGRIPDFLLLLWAVFIVSFNLFTKNPSMGEYSLCGAFFFLLFYLLFRLSGSLGFGDVKFAGLLGYTLNFDRAFFMCIFSAFLCLIVYAAGILWYHWDKSAKIPFAPFLSAGAFVAVLLR